MKTLERTNQGRQRVELDQLKQVVAQTSDRHTHIIHLGDSGHIQRLSLLLPGRLTERDRHTEPEERKGRETTTTGYDVTAAMQLWLCG